MTIRRKLYTSPLGQANRFRGGVARQDGFVTFLSTLYNWNSCGSFNKDVIPYLFVEKNDATYVFSTHLHCDTLALATSYGAARSCVATPILNLPLGARQDDLWRAPLGASRNCAGLLPGILSNNIAADRRKLQVFDNFTGNYLLQTWSNFQPTRLITSYGAARFCVTTPVQNLPLSLFAKEQLFHSPLGIGAGKGFGPGLLPKLLANNIAATRLALEVFTPQQNLAELLLQAQPFEMNLSASGIIRSCVSRPLANTPSLWQPLWQHDLGASFNAPFLPFHLGNNSLRSVIAPWLFDPKKIHAVTLTMNLAVNSAIVQYMGKWFPAEVVALTVTGRATTFTLTRRLVAEKLALTAESQEITFFLPHRYLIADHRALTVSLKTAPIVRGLKLSCGSVSLTLASSDVELKFSKTISAQTKALIISSNVCQLKRATKITCSSRQVALTFSTNNLKFGHNLSAQTKGLSLATTDIVTRRGKNLPCVVKSLALTLGSGSLRFDRLLSAVVSEVTLTSANQVLIIARKFQAQTASVSLTRLPAAVTFGHLLTTQVKNLTVVGKDINFRHFKMPCQTLALNITGIAETFRKTNVLKGTAYAMTIARKPANVLAGKKIGCSVRGITLTPKTLTFRRTFRLVPVSRSLTLTTQSANLKFGHKLFAQTLPVACDMGEFYMLYGLTLIALRKQLTVIASNTSIKATRRLTATTRQLNTAKFDAEITKGRTIAATSVGQLNFGFSSTNMIVGRKLNGVTASVDFTFINSLTHYSLKAPHYPAAVGSSALNMKATRKLQLVKRATIVSFKPANVRAQRLITSPAIHLTLVPTTLIQVVKRKIKTSSKRVEFNFTSLNMLYGISYVYAQADRIAFDYVPERVIFNYGQDRVVFSFDDSRRIFAFGEPVRIFDFEQDRQIFYTEFEFRQAS